ncbi:MAG TPA: DUF4129 domain-containing protein, partial [Thermoplasmata archaeon]
VFLVAALSIGLAATFLAAPATAPGPTPAAHGPGAVSFSVVGWFSVGLLVVIIGALVARRLFARSGGPAGRPLVSFLVVFLVALAFLVAVRFVDPTAVGLEPTPDVPGSTQPGSDPGSNGTILNHTTFLPTPLSPHLPGWLLYIGLAVAVAVALFLVPLVVARRARAAEVAPAPSAVRRPLADALAALSVGEGADARAVVIRLYAELLDRVGPQLDSVEAATPREIERECVARFGIQAEHARALTRLFEEARYSTHPFTDREVGQARSSLSLALADIDRAGARA